MTDVYFATNRDDLGNGKFGDRFNAEGPHFYKVGRATVTWRGPIPEPEKRDWTYWDDYSVSTETAAETPPETLPVTGTPECHVKTVKGAKLGSTGIFTEIRRKMVSQARDSLVYIHGFANDFDNSMARAAQLSEVYKISPGGNQRPYSPDVFAFSWPSNGKVEPPWEYASDRDDAAMSGLAMARAIRRLADFLEKKGRCNGRLHLVAHSMGNWALRHAVLGLVALYEGKTLPKFFDNVFLMAADEDEDCLGLADKLGRLPEMCRRINVYHSSGDQALEVSDKTKFNMDRLGTDGPKTFSGLSTRIVAIDCSAVDKTKLTHGNHQYYRLRPEVIADVRQVLSARTPPDQIPGREVIVPGRQYRIPAPGGQNGEEEPADSLGE